MTRRRRRASDIADVRPRRGLGAAFLLAIGLALVLLSKAGVGEGTADFLAEVTGDPALEMPPSVTDAMDFGPPEAGPIGGATLRVEAPPPPDGGKPVDAGDAARDD